MNAHIGIQENNFKVTWYQLEPRLTFSGLISFETALDAAMLDQPEHYEAIGRALITELFSMREQWMGLEGLGGLGSIDNDF
jgi:hypothetical protein